MNATNWNDYLPVILIVVAMISLMGAFTVNFRKQAKIGVSLIAISAVLVIVAVSTLLKMDEELLKTVKPVLISTVSLLTLVLAIYVGFRKGVNTGLVSIAFAFLLGFLVLDKIKVGDAEVLVPLSSHNAKAATLVKGWPSSLFFMLLGMTLLFSIARANKTLELFARKTAYLSKGNRKLLPIIFFFLAAGLAAVGPGNIAVCALLLPIAMAVSKEEEINPLLMAGVTIAGANGGGLSPIAPTGVVAARLSTEIGFEIGTYVFKQMMIAQIIVAAVLYLGLGGLKLKKGQVHEDQKPAPFEAKQKLTLLVIAFVVLTIMIPIKVGTINYGQWNIGFSAFIGATFLLLCKAADEKQAIAGVPWSTLILICGVGVLVNVVKIGGGIDLLTNTLKLFMNEKTAGGIITLIGGLMSAVSSASGVVMPTLIPTVPGLVDSLGVSGLTLITGVVLGAHFVTNSPLSTLGALAMASADESIDKAKFFNKLLALGFGGVAFGSLLVLFGIVG
ncbi:MAG: SLC13 family permease [Peptostreptococcaceae bacterium]|nr:SLC13 family permease [Peptostreptococcaceae bacterium]